MKNKKSYSKKTRLVFGLFAILILLLLSCNNSTNIEKIHVKKTKLNNESIKKERLLYTKNISDQEFNFAVNNKKNYKYNSEIKAAVVTHHLLASPLISGLFDLLKNNVKKYDTIIVIAPNHNNDLTNIIYSDKNWQTDDIVFADTEIIESINKFNKNNFTISQNDDTVENDHSASVMIPFINKYLPDTKVVPILINRLITLEGIINFSDQLNKLIFESDKNILLLSSIDFSHYLKPYDAISNDFITKEAMYSSDFNKIYTFNNNFVDSPSSLIIFLNYLKQLKIIPNILDNTDASYFINPSIEETTTYFVIVG